MTLEQNRDELSEPQRALEQQEQKRLWLGSADFGKRPKEGFLLNEMPQATEAEEAALKRAAEIFSFDYAQERDVRLLASGATQCTILADTLDGEIQHLHAHGASRHMGVYLQGDLGEAAVIRQWQGAGEAHNTNDSSKLHDNHPLIDFEIDAEKYGIEIAGDSKVSATDNPNGYYKKKLGVFDDAVASGKLSEHEAKLFIPHDQVPGMRASIDRHFARLSHEQPDMAATYSQAAERWQARVHESTLSSAQYRHILEQCRESPKSLWIETARLETLRDDLRTASDYLRRCFTADRSE